MLLILLWLVFGIIGAVVAAGKNRSAIGWFFICMLVPLLGFILLLVLPDPTKPTKVIVVEKERPKQIAPPVTEEAAARQGSVTAEQWRYLVEYDPVIRPAASSLAPLGARALDEFRDAFITLQDRALVPSIVDRIREKHAVQADAESSVTTTYPVQQSGAAELSARRVASAITQQSSRQIPTHRTVTAEELQGAEFLENHRGHNLFQLRDGRVYIDRYAAVQYLDHARYLIDRSDQPARA